MEIPQFQKVYWQTAKFRNPYRGKLVQNNTRLYRESDEQICLMLHQTNIITWYPTHIVLNSGGYHTHTTKKRINEWLDGAYVFQKNFEWYVEHHDTGAKLDFEDGMELRPLPTIVQKIMRIAQTDFKIR